MKIKDAGNADADQYQHTGCRFRGKRTGLGLSHTGRCPQGDTTTAHTRLMTGQVRERNYDPLCIGIIQYRGERQGIKILIIEYAEVRPFLTREILQIIVGLAMGTGFMG